MRIECSYRRTLFVLVLIMGVGSQIFSGVSLAAEPLSPLKRVPLDQVLAVAIDPDVDPKGYWQARYTKLLRQRAVEDEVIDRERELYADANRRNYRRGNKRHVHLETMNEAMARKGEVEDRLHAFREEARREGVLPGWLYEVEDSWRDTPIGPPAVAADIEVDASDEADRAGRNPIYLDDEDGS